MVFVCCFFFFFGLRFFFSNFSLFFFFFSFFMLDRLCCCCCWKKKLKVEPNCRPHYTMETGVLFRFMWIFSISSHRLAPSLFESEQSSQLLIQFISDHWFNPSNNRKLFSLLFAHRCGLPFLSDQYESLRSRFEHLFQLHPTVAKKRSSKRRACSKCKRMLKTQHVEEWKELVENQELQFCIVFTTLKQSPQATIRFRHFLSSQNIRKTIHYYLYQPEKTQKNENRLRKEKPATAEEEKEEEEEQKEEKEEKEKEEDGEETELDEDVKCKEEEEEFKEIELPQSLSYKLFYPDSLIGLQKTAKQKLNCDVILVFRFHAQEDLNAPSQCLTFTWFDKKVSALKSKPKPLLPLSRPLKQPKLQQLSTLEQHSPIPTYCKHSCSCGFCSHASTLTVSLFLPCPNCLDCAKDFSVFPPLSIVDISAFKSFYQSYFSSKSPHYSFTISC